MHEASIPSAVEYLSAFGFGDTFILEDGNTILIESRLHPWSAYAKDVQHLIYRGFLSGLLKRVLSKDVDLKLKEEPKIGEGYTLILTT
jgi:hypothetical protein